MSSSFADLQSRLAQLGIQRDQDAYPPDDDTMTAIQQITDAEARWKRDVDAKPKPFQPLPRSALVASHRDMLPATDLPRSRSEVAHRSTFIGQDKYFSSTSMEHLKPITLREMQCNRVHKGFYLACRTFLSPVRGVAVSLYVEDTQGDTIMIGTYNMPGTFQAGRRQLDAHFPVGTALVVREPWMKMSGAGGAYMMLRVDSPSDIMILTPNTGLLRNISWKTSSPDRLLLSRRSAGDWKVTGDQYFREKMNVAALMAWTHALNLDPNLTTISLNRAQAYLNLKWYGAAFADALHAADISSSEAHLFKAQYRAALAEYGLGLYREAFNRLKALEGGDNDERKVVIGRCIERLKERDGRFDLLKMHRISTKKGLVPLDTADFISHAIRVAQIPERGGGRGIRATRDIKTGELLMVHKPFSAATPENVSPMEPITVMNFATRSWKDASQVALVERTVSRLLACPEDAPGVLNLYAGPKYPPLPADYNLQPTPGHSVVDPLSWSIDIDIARVEGVVSYNAFNPRPVSPYDPDADNLDDSGSRSCILYTSPSLFNHACHANAHWVCFGTTMIVRALADISTGEEITISYVNGPTAFDRATTLKSFFAEPCDCAMCVEDRRAGASTCASRQAIAAETSAILEMPKAAHTARAREARRILKKLQSTYADGGSSSVPQPILFKTYANATHAVIDAAGSTEGTGGFREAISLGIESIRAIGFEDVDGELGTAAPSTRFELPLGKRRLGHPSMKDAVVLSLSRIAASFMIIGQEIRAERWYRAAWWAHDACYGGGQGFFDERFRDAVGSAPKPVNMVYKWS